MSKFLERRYNRRTIRRIREKIVIPERFRKIPPEVEEALRRQAKE